MAFTASTFSLRYTKVSKTLATLLYEGIIAIMRRRCDLDREVTKDPEVQACLQGAQPVSTHPLTPFSK